MTRLRLILLSFVLPLALGACGEKEAPDEVAASPASTSLLAYVPADTPYLFANLQPVPNAVVDAFFARAEPVLEELQAQASRMRSDLASGNEQAEDPQARLLLAWIEAYDGKMNRQGLEAMGWDFQSSSVLYGNGAFPVMRVSSSDPQALAGSVMEILASAGMDAPPLDYRGQPYWRIDSGDSDEVPIALYVAVLDDHFALGVYPMVAEDTFLPGFLGLDMPADHYTTDALAQLNKKYGYTPYGSGFMDLHRLADEFMDPQATTARTLMSFEDYDLENFSEQCAAETHRLIDNMPYISAGTTEMGVDAIAYRAVFEHPTALAKELTGLVATLPGARALSDRLAELSFGIKVGAARDFLREKAEAVVNDPFQCEHFADINQQAGELLDQLNQPLPPFVNNFRGIRMSIKELDIVSGEMIPKNVRGHLAVHVEQPEMFVGMAQMFLPDLTEMNLAPGEKPEPVPEFLMSVQGMSAYAAMTEHAIGISVGEGEQDTLVDFLEMDDGHEGTFLSADYDAAAYYELQEKALPQDESFADDDPMMPLYEAIMEAAKASADREHTDLRFTADGLVIESRTTYK